MGWEHEAETVWRAQELYCVDRLSFAQTAEVTGVAASSLKRWAEKYSWREKREEIARAEAEIRVNKIKARAKVIEALLDKPRADMAFAVSALENQALKQQELALAGKIPTALAPQERPQIKTRAEAVVALRQAVENKIGLALQSPEHITCAAVKDISQCLNLMQELEAGLSQNERGDEEKKRGLSADILNKLYAAAGIRVNE